jgi:large subunit ribosomal protein L15
MPLARRLPKIGFTNIFAKDFEVTDVAKLSKFAAGALVDAEVLKAAGVVSRIGKNGVKVLGNGELTVALHVRVAKLTKSAAEKIVAAGGTIEGDIPG